MNLRDLQFYLAADFPRFLAYKTEQLGYDQCARHLETAEFLQAPGRRKALMGPRLWSAKTTIVRWYVCWRWLRNKATKVIVWSNTDDNAKEMTGAIHHDLRTDQVTEYLAPNVGKIGEYQFNLRNYRPEKGKSIRSAGLTTTLTSDRADLILIDDTESDKLPEARYDLVIANFSEAEALLYEQGRLYGSRGCPPQEELQFLVVGQPHWEGSAYVVPPVDPVTGKREQEHPLENVDFLWLPAMVNANGESDDSPETGASHFPEVVSTEKCYRKKRSMGRSKWRLEYMLDTHPQQAERAIIHIHQIIPVSRIPRVSIMVVDPADAGEDTEWGLAIGGLCETQIHLRHIDGLRETDFREYDTEDDVKVVEKLWGRIFEWGLENNVLEIWLEKNLVSAIRSCQRYINKHGLPIAVKTFSAVGKKIKRIIDAVELPIKSGMVTTEPYVLWDKKTLKQMRNLRSSKLPKPCDRIDAMASLFLILMENPVTAVVDVSDRAPTLVRHASGKAISLHGKIQTRTREARLGGRRRARR